LTVRKGGRRGGRNIKTGGLKKKGGKKKSGERAGTTNQDLLLGSKLGDR